MTLYVRNETSTPITANGIGAKRFELSAKGNVGDSKVLPLSVASLPGFQRTWAATSPKQVTVSQNADFSSPITSIPDGEYTSDNVKPASATTAGLVKKAAAQPDSTATDVEGLKSDLNSLMAKLRAAGTLG